MIVLRLAPLAIFLLVQLLIIADELNERREEPLETSAWVSEFTPLIIYLVAAVLYNLITLVSSARHWCIRGDQGGIETDDEASADGSTASSSQQQYGGAQRLVKSDLKRRIALVYFWNALIDLALLIPASVFLGLLIDQLFRIDDAVVGNEQPWSLVLIPLEVLFGVAAIVLILAAFRVCGEATYQRSLGNSEYLSAAMSGVLVCCPLDRDYAAQAEWQQREKRTDYIADGAYHELPCVFMFTPSMTYGVADILLAWLLYVFLVGFLLTLVVVGLLIDGQLGTATLDQVFAGLYVVEGLLIATSLLLLLSLCLWRNAGNQRPAGRKSLGAKFYEAVFVISVAALLIAQQALLARDEVAQNDWFVTFIPLFIAFSIVILAAFFELTCCGNGRRAQQPVTTVAQSSDPRAIRSTGARPQNLAGPKPVSVHHKSLWGAAY